MISLTALTRPLATVLADRRAFVLANGLGYAALIALHAQVPWFTQENAWVLHGHMATDMMFGDGTSPVVLALQNLAYLYLCGLYGLMLLHWRTLSLGVREIFAYGALLGLLAWCALPADSPDIFTYVEFGRLAAVYHLNPYLSDYSDLADFYSPYAWFTGSMPYGPVVLPVFAVAAWISQLNVLAALYFLKLVWLAVHLASAWLLWRLLVLEGIDPRPGLLLFVFNPLLLIDLVGNGHNDGLLVCFSLAALNALQRGRMVWAIGLALAAALVKLPAVVLLAGLLVLLCRQRRWGALFAGSAVCLVALATLHWTLFPTAEAVRNLINPNVGFWNSIRGLLPAPELFVSKGTKVAILLVFVGTFALFALWRLAKVRDLVSLAGETAHLLLAVLIGYTPQFWPWYAAWLLPYAPLCPTARLRESIVLLSCTGLLTIYALPFHVWEYSLALKLVRLALVFGVPLAWLLWPGLPGETARVAERLHGKPSRGVLP